MPFIDVKIIEGVFDDAQKEQLIAELADAVVRVGGEAMRPMTRCAIQEIRSGRWAVGGGGQGDDDGAGAAGGGGSAGRIGIGVMIAAA